MECAVRPPASNKEAIPDDATPASPRSLLRTSARRALHRGVFPDPPGPSMTCVPSAAEYTSDVILWNATACSSLSRGVRICVDFLRHRCELWRLGVLRRIRPQMRDLWDGRKSGKRAPDSAEILVELEDSFFGSLFGSTRREVWRKRIPHGAWRTRGALCKNCSDEHR